ncbi:MAG: tRNA-intron lyase [Candidatus Aenigmarchaeota archaeon]|nr:tRNA-intron lyase [Candidatus Aenigmarchaeota archaeon]
MIKAYLKNDRVVIWDLENSKDIFEKKYFGRLKDNRLELALVEAAYLIEKKKISLFDNKKKMKFEQFFEYCKKIDKRFELRYKIYRDLRNKKLPTRSGFKFGCDFRVYAKGTNPMKRGKKTEKEHTKWVVFAIPDNYEMTFVELSRAVRLAHNIRANMLWGVVGKKNINYVQVKFFKP